MTITAAVMATIGAVSSIAGGIMGKKSASEAAREEARAEGVVTIAKLEDLKAEERALRGQTIAGAAGSGIKVGVGSPIEILKEQAATFARERMTVSKVGATRASVLTKRGKMVGSAAAYQSFSQATGQLASAFSMFPKYLGQQPGPG